jgi:glyoxylase-like metal-dependent hydrolase (beta-lactamase superfamily II)
MTDTTTLVETRRLGRLQLHAINAGGQKLDGGAMFGVVPKPLWSRRIQPDDRNRIPLAMRVLLIEHDRGLVLVDTGAGNKEDAKFHEIYGVENTGASGRTLLEDALRQLGHSPEAVTLVIDTHLHFDHAGGNTWVDEEGVVHASFPRARYVVQRGEYDWATHPNERTAASYFARNWNPIVAAGLFDFVEGEREHWPGIRLIPTPGHTPYHQGVLLESDGERLFYAADLMPTSAHVPLPWIMAYDVEPLVTLESKRTILRRAVDEDWLVMFEHDPAVGFGRIRSDGKGYGVDSIVPGA